MYLQFYVWMNMHCTHVEARAQWKSLFLTSTLVLRQGSLLFCCYVATSILGDSPIHLPQFGEIVVICQCFCHYKVAEEQNTSGICAAIMKISVIKFQKSKSRYIIWPDYTSIQHTSKGFVIYPLDTYYS